MYACDDGNINRNIKKMNAGNFVANFHDETSYTRNVFA